MEDQTQSNRQSAIENPEITLDEVTEGSSTDPRPSSAKRSGGPRTAQGKRRSSQNARKHGLYTDERFLESAALELGEDPRQFRRILKGLVEARRPVGALELALVEDIALLFLKKARLDKAELAVQVSNLYQHDLERRKQMIQVGHADSDATEFDVREKGLRRSLDSPGKYEQVLTLLGGLLALIDKGEFGYRMQEGLRTLYGTEHTLRGAELDTLRYKLSRTKPEEESYEPARKAMTVLVAKEAAAVGGQYELFLRARGEHTGVEGGGDGSVARAVGGDHPPAELSAAAVGAQDTPADGIAEGTEGVGRGWLPSSVGGGAGGGGWQHYDGTNHPQPLLREGGESARPHRSGSRGGAYVPRSFIGMYAPITPRHPADGAK